MVYWNVSVQHLAGVITGGTVLLPCGVSYEEYRKDLVSYGFKPVECKGTEVNYKSAEIKWHEICSRGIENGSEIPHSPYPIARWKQPMRNTVFRIPVNHCGVYTKYNHRDRKSFYLHDRGSNYGN